MIKEIEKMEEQAFDMRKKIVIKKLEIIYDVKGTDGLKKCLDALNKFTGFKHGSCIDFDNFKKDVLTSKGDLINFIDFYSNTCLDMSELMYLGFDDVCHVVEETKFFDEVCDAIEGHEFYNSDLYEFEEYLDNIYVDC